MPIQVFESSMVRHMNLSWMMDCWIISSSPPDSDPIGRWYLPPVLGYIWFDLDVYLETFVAWRICTCLYWNHLLYHLIYGIAIVILDVPAKCQRHVKHVFWQSDLRSNKRQSYSSMYASCVKCWSPWPKLFFTSVVMWFHIQSSWSSHDVTCDIVHWQLLISTVRMLYCVEIDASASS